MVSGALICALAGVHEAKAQEITAAIDKRFACAVSESGNKLLRAEAEKTLVLKKVLARQQASLRNLRARKAALNKSGKRKLAALKARIKLIKKCRQGRPPFDWESLRESADPPPDASSSQGSQSSSSSSESLFSLRLEAEHAAYYGAWNLVEGPEFSGGQALAVGEDAADNSFNQSSNPARAVYVFALPCAGNYRVFASMQYPEGTEAEFFVSLDAGEFSAFGFSGEGAPALSELMTAELEKGVHVLVIHHNTRLVEFDYLQVEQAGACKPDADPLSVRAFYESTGVLGRPIPPAPQPQGRALYVGNASELQAAIAGYQSGDAIIVRNGTYEDWVINLPPTLSGSGAAPVIFRAEDDNGVRLRGSSQIIVRGNHVYVRGFDFHFVRPSSFSIYGDYNTITANRFIAANYGISYPVHTMMIRASADNNTIEHNLFTMTTGLSLTLSQPAPGSGLSNPTNNIIRRNSFKFIPYLFLNGGESIMAGLSQDEIDGFDDNTFTLIEGNRFEKADGDSEIVSLKSSSVTVRGNSFIRSRGHLSFRSGNNSIAEQNLFLDTSGGVRLTGSGHIVRNNVMFLPPTGHAFMVMDGSVSEEGVINYISAHDNLVAHNTIVGGKNLLFFMRGSGITTDLARNNVLVNNAAHLWTWAIGVQSASPYSALEGLERNSVYNNVLWADGGQLMPELGEQNFIAEPHLIGDELMPMPSAQSDAVVGQGLSGYASHDFFDVERSTAPDLGAFESGGAQ